MALTIDAFSTRAYLRCLREQTSFSVVACVCTDRETEALRDGPCELENLLLVSFRCSPDKRRRELLYSLVVQCGGADALFVIAS